MPADRREDNRGLLAEFGLGDLAERVWLTLLSTPNASIDEIGASTGVDGSAVRDALTELADAGLARPESSACGFGVHEPTIAIETLIARGERELASRRERLGAIRTSVPDLAEIYTRARASSQNSADLDVVHAFDEIQERIFLAGETTRSEHRHFMRGVRAETVRNAVRADTASLGRGVHQRSIIGTRDLADPEVFAALAQLHELGEEIRAVPNVPTQLMIMDRDLAVVPRSADDQSQGAIFIREPALVALLVFLFDQMWSVGLPVFEDPKTAGAPAGRAARVLELMAAGIKDERIARALGVGSRTVRRDIAELKDALGVSSRTEIVAAALRQGWL
ncbi:MAG TPA: LuxR C-terminal-related transcriptional regulator [Mycobacteriales bacterium]|nr:LuxR C-terminal-related transcriptional regulator [Mycobacteriales bacterium]